ncbi:hypothetical protein LMG19282_04328 [Cupriavidus campinensis]|uniref:FixH family protein n=1 Tax=Cupriavidus campinensis TaxID=151783 RepID=A0ABY3EID2_9BURK|nr:hypothetical protein [Cupriavidus campinensis]TSP10675.1 hypothetical protein FGG12_21530 [Cupriavidus campinensis]CAG2153019.1 hypothetical protein LMG19282_04328 [Cupriavidus campinensis]
MTAQQIKPWWKEPWPWLLMSGPLLAMIGCGVTIWLANTHTDVPVRNAARHGLVVEKLDGSAARADAHVNDTARRP